MWILLEGTGDCGEYAPEDVDLLIDRRFNWEVVSQEQRDEMQKWLEDLPLGEVAQFDDRRTIVQVKVGLGGPP